MLVAHFMTKNYRVPITVVSALIRLTDEDRSKSNKFYLQPLKQIDRVQNKNIVFFLRDLMPRLVEKGMDGILVLAYLV